MSTIFRPPQRVVSQRMPTKSSKYVEKQLLLTILVHRHRCSPLRNPVFSSAIHHPGLAGIVKKRNCRIRDKYKSGLKCGFSFFCFFSGWLLCLDNIYSRFSVCRFWAFAGPAIETELLLRPSDGLDHIVYGLIP